MNNYYNYQNYLNQAKQNMNIDPSMAPAMPQQFLNNPNQNINMQDNMMQQKKFPQKESGMQKDLYEPYEGFLRGNMFPQLYSPYKVKQPYEIRPINEQADMLTYIDSLGFAMIDLNLYLDVYPEDKRMIDLYNEYRMRKKDIQKQYEQKFGPLVLTSDALNTYPWAWDNKPWPWENE